MAVTYNKQTKTLSFTSDSKGVGNSVLVNLLTLLRDEGNIILDAEKAIFDLEYGAFETYFANLGSLNSASSSGKPIYFNKVKKIIFGPKIKTVGVKNEPKFIVAQIFPNVKEISVLGEAVLGTQVFCNLDLDYISMPKVTNFNDACFKGTTFKNTKFYLPATLVAISNSVFQDTNITTLVFNNRPSFISTFIFGYFPSKVNIQKLVLPDYTSFSTVVLSSVIAKQNSSERIPIKIEITNSSDIDQCKEKYAAGYLSGGIICYYDVINIKPDIYKTTKIFED